MATSKIIEVIFFCPVIAYIGHLALVVDCSSERHVRFVSVHFFYNNTEKYSMQYIYYSLTLAYWALVAGSNFSLNIFFILR